MPDDKTQSKFETALLQAIHRFFVEQEEGPLAGIGGDAETVTDHALQVATTILFLQIIASDHESRRDEFESLNRAVADVLGFTGDEASVLIRVAEEKIRTPFADLLNAVSKRCSVQQKKKLVRNLWALAFADAELVGQEEYLVRKVSESIGLSNADLIEAKIDAREAFFDGEPAEPR